MEANLGELVMNETDTIEQLLAGAETAVLAVLKELPSRSPQHLRLNSARWQLQEALLRVQQMQDPAQAVHLHRVVSA